MAVMRVTVSGESIIRTVRPSAGLMRPGVVIAAEDIRRCADILERHGYDSVKAPIIDERLSGQVCKTDCAAWDRVKPGGNSDCRKRFF